MFKELEEEECVCFKCGHTPQEFTYNEEELAVCPECNSPSIVGITQVIDLINDLIEKGILNEDLSYRRLPSRTESTY